MSLTEDKNMKNKISYLKGKINVVFVISMIFSLSCQTHQSGTPSSEKTLSNDFDNRKVKVISILQELSHIEYSDNDQAEETRLKNSEENVLKIKKIVDKLDDAEDLMTLALMSKTLGESCRDVECAKTSNLRPTYRNTYWVAVEKLAAKKETNKKILDELKIRSQLSGTDVGDWGRIVEGKEFP